MKIKIMKIKDFIEMYGLWKKVGINVMNFDKEEQQTKLIIKLNPSSNFIATDGEKIIGTVFGTFNGKRGWIYHLAVDPLYQNKGIGSKLLLKAEKALKKRGAKRVLLGVANFNLETSDFYKKLGYSKVDDAIWMVKDL